MGEPLFAMSDPKYRNDPVIRLTVMLGSIVDLPFSVVTDTVLLPFDWKAAGAANQTNGEQLKECRELGVLRSET